MKRPPRILVFSVLAEIGANLGYFVLDFQRGYFCRVDFLIEAMPRNTRRRNPRRHIFCCKLIFCVEVMYVISFVETLLNRREIFCFCLAIDVHGNIQGNGNKLLLSMTV
jgi:hypothetical protein